MNYLENIFLRSALTIFSLVNLILCLVCEMNENNLYRCVVEFFFPNKRDERKKQKINSLEALINLCYCCCLIGLKQY